MEIKANFLRVLNGQWHYQIWANGLLVWEITGSSRLACSMRFHEQIDLIKSKLLN